MELGFGIVCNPIRHAMGNQDEKGEQVEDIIQEGPLGEGPAGDDTSNGIPGNREDASNAGQGPIHWL